MKRKIYICSLLVFPSLNGQTLAKIVVSVMLMIGPLLGCAGVPLKSIPPQLRIPIYISPLKDQTGAYNQLDQSFELLAQAALQSNFIKVPDPLSSDHFAQIVYQNPFRSVSTPIADSAMYTVSGEVERIAYDPIQNIDQKIVGFRFFGILGLAATKTNDMVAFIQYRFFIYSRDRIPIDSFVVASATSGDVNSLSRKALMSETNYVAACSFASEFVSRAVKAGTVHAEYRRTSGQSSRVERRSCCDSLNIYLSPTGKE